jgi:hypothetical protein
MIVKGIILRTSKSVIGPPNSVNNESCVCHTNHSSLTEFGGPRTRFEVRMTRFEGRLL